MIECGDQIGRGGSGIVYEARYGTEELALKFAHNFEDVALEVGARQYEGISVEIRHTLPTFFGLYRSDPYKAIVMSRVGVPILEAEQLLQCAVRSPPFLFSQTAISSTHSSTIFADVISLQTFGWIHGNLRVENIVQQIDGRLRLVDLWHAADGHDCRPESCSELCEAIALLNLPETLLHTAPLRGNGWRSST